MAFLIEMAFAPTEVPNALATSFAPNHDQPEAATTHSKGTDEANDGREDNNPLVFREIGHESINGISVSRGQLVQERLIGRTK